MGAEMELGGMQQLLNDLQQLGDRTARVENKALRSGAEILQRAISSRTPRSAGAGDHAADHIAIGRVKLRDGIKTVSVGIEKTDRSKWFYLKFHEFGTSKMPARPFMGPAAAESERDVVEAIADVVKGALHGG